MKKITGLFLIICLLFIGIFVLTGCRSQERFNVTWQDDNGDVIYTTTVRFGDIPEFNKDDYDLPTRQDAAHWTYEFRDWIPSPMAISRDMTFRPHFYVEINEDSQGFIEISAGRWHTLAIDPDGGLWGWGHNGHGRLGDGTTSMRPNPVQIMADTDTRFKSVSAGAWHSLAVDVDGGLWSWGMKDVGEVGDVEGNNITPMHIAQGTEFVSVSAGSWHSLALDVDGNIWAWGRNTRGQLGNNTTDAIFVPVQVTFGTRFEAIEAGASFSLALDEGGRLYSWGANTQGQLGNGDVQNASDVLTPTRVAAGMYFEQVAAGSSHVLAITTSGALWAWGFNGYGQIGDGTRVSRFEPVAVMSDTAFIQIAAGDYHSLAINTGGKLFGWGLNSRLQLANAPDNWRGWVNFEVSPVSIHEGMTFKAITAGGGLGATLDSGHTLATRTDGQVVALGFNGFGQQGGFRDLYCECDVCL